MRKVLWVSIIYLVLIACQSDGYNPTIQKEKAKPVPVGQGGIYDGTWTGEAISVPFTDECGGAELVIEITNSSLKGTGSDLQGSRLGFNGFISDGQSIYAESSSTFIGNLKITGRFISERTAKGTWKAGKGCKGIWLLTKE
ncbi:MAG: hypothetical protein JRF72_03945 [Deltaproteobacteria bacterium]|jgi:hypothetical protein|nr:hypothetical protein [Deltaproteobacteria bacterium]